MPTFRLAVLALSLATTPLVAQQPTVDHGAYDRLLQRHVVDGLVNYDAFAGDSSFTRYLDAMSRVDPSLLTSEDRIAYWINMYNAWTIRLITSNGERESIRNINRTFGFLELKGPWTEPIVRAAGRTLSLDQVQYEMIRRESSDPRIHFALSCGARSCAPLRSEAYTGARLDEQLHDQGRVFLTTDSTWNWFDVKTRTFHRNLVFRHFRPDFAETRNELGSFLAQWYNDTTPVLVERMQFQMRRPPGDTAPASDSTVGDRFESVTLLKTVQSGAFGVVDLPFDWSLNSQTRTRTTGR